MHELDDIAGSELEVISPDRSTRVVRISSSPFLIGRGQDIGNHLLLDDGRISRQCAAIVSEDTGFILEDRGQRRGLFVNGKKIDRAPLGNGDIITFGAEQSYEIVFRSRSAESPVQSMMTMIGAPATTVHGVSPGLGKLTLLLEATSLLHSELPLESVLGSMLDHAISITHADRGLLMEPDASGSLRVRLARGSHGVSVSGEVKPSQTALRQAMQQRKAVITEDLNVAEESLQAALSIVAQSLRAVIAIPLFAVARTNAANSPSHSEPGHFLGVLYLDSRRPTAFSRLDRQILDALAAQAASILDSARLVEQERKRLKLEQELNIARDIQQALIPHGFRDFSYFEVTGIHTPCQAVGGDYFDVFPLSEDRSVIIVADVSGKGIGAALLTTMLQGAFSGMTPGTDPVQVLSQLNRFLCDHYQVGRYATMFFSILDRDGRLYYINAGHTSPLLLRSGQVTDLVTEGSFPVGLLPDATFSAKTAELLPGDTLALYSDGVTEAIDPDENAFGDDRLAHVLAGKQQTPLGELQNEILKSVETFCRGANQSDDITVLLVRYRPESPSSSH
jgi:serine phosphatase RsbU (regulator of sigma subunit)